MEESHRAVRTIDDLLKLSQIESVRPGDTPVSLTSIVQSAIARGHVVDGGRSFERVGHDVRRAARGEKGGRRGVRVRRRHTRARAAARGQGARRRAAHMGRCQVGRDGRVWRDGRGLDERFYEMTRSS